MLRIFNGRTVWGESFGTANSYESVVNRTDKGSPCKLSGDTLQPAQRLIQMSHKVSVFCEAGVTEENRATAANVIVTALILKRKRKREREIRERGRGGSRREVAKQRMKEGGKGEVHSAPHLAPTPSRKHVCLTAVSYA